MDHRDTIRELMNTDGRGETFCRMWEFYLAACESAFLHDNLVVYQCQLARRHGLVPITRDYLY
jgi:cyclopropane-fatty-acyl-phospholipid synthase